jgi:dihydropteroate synthase
MTTWTLHLGSSLWVLTDWPKVMGILNLTPDSFSDGGLFVDPGAAAHHAHRMIAEGAELLDLGAESTRPGGGVYGRGAAELTADEEWRRLAPVLPRLRAELPAAIISVDTRKAEVARRAFDAGADLVNDVGGLRDPAMAETVAAAGCPLILMHSRGELRNMQQDIHFGDVVAEVAAELAATAAKAMAAGVRREQIVLDPGIGFGKRLEHNLALLARIGELGELAGSFPLLVGASRKSFVDKISPAPPTERLGGSLAAAAAAVRGGAAILRVHDVAASVQFLRVLRAIEEASRVASPGAM